MYFLVALISAIRLHLHPSLIKISQGGRGINFTGRGRGGANAKVWYTCYICKWGTYHRLSNVSKVFVLKNDRYLRYRYH